MFYEFQHLGTPDRLCKEYGENLCFPMHLHRAFELIVLLDGSMTVTVDGRDYELSAGEAVLIFPNQIHSIRSQSSRDVLVIFSPETVSAYSRRLTGYVPVSNKFRLDGYLTDRVLRLDSDIGEVEMKGVLYSVCAELDRGADYVGRDGAPLGVLYKIFGFVDASYGGDCTLGRLARETGYGYSYLSRCFKAAVGISFNSYVNGYRVSKACHLLRNTEKTVLECAMECGYSSLRSFNRNFKIHTGVTPLEYRAGRDAERKEDLKNGKGNQK